MTQHIGPVLADFASALADFTSVLAAVSSSAADRGQQLRRTVQQYAFLMQQLGSAAASSPLLVPMPPVPPLPTKKGAQDRDKNETTASSVVGCGFSRRVAADAWSGRRPRFGPATFFDFLGASFRKSTRVLRK